MIKKVTHIDEMGEIIIEILSGRQAVSPAVHALILAIKPGDSADKLAEAFDSAGVYHNLKCDECEESCDSLAQIGDDPDIYDGLTMCICKKCLEKALEKLKSNE